MDDVDPLDVLYDTLDVIQKAVRSKKLQSLQAKLYKKCVSHHWQTEADEIAAVDWSDFKRETLGVIDGIFERKDPEIKAVYFEYFPDNFWEGWKSEIAACTNYSDSTPEGEDRWIGDRKETCPVNFPLFPEIKIDSSLSDLESVYPFLYAISVLTGVMLEIADERRATIPICLGFHNQSELTRL